MVDIDFIVDELKKDQNVQKIEKKEPEQKDQKKKVTKTVQVTTTTEEIHEQKDNPPIQRGKKALIDTEEITELIKEPVKKVKKRRVKKAHKPVLAKKELKQTKTITSKKTRKIGDEIKGSVTLTKLMKEMQELKHQLKDLTKLFAAAAEEMKKPDPFAEKLAEISEQNERIAEALLVVADIVKESKKELEDIEVPLSELPDFKFNPEEPPIPKPPEYMQDTPPNRYAQSMPDLPPGEIREELQPLDFRQMRQSSQPAFDSSMPERPSRIPLKQIKQNIPPPPLRQA